ncbi:peroxynitrite isomerase THAP4-like [Saccostrea cucullata]|uniref:peroxynitrite isomerase THAP4-like n=1 Tax=Saccostrea cuccullata TaxID=36930 RepID=UPI002ED1686D
MPSSCCCVPGCHERGGHQFPTEKSRRDKWIIAIKRLDEHTRKLWEPSKSAFVCKGHFKPDDYVTETIQGQKPLHGRLKSSSVPSIFCWTKSSAASTSRFSRVEGRVQKKRKFEEACHDDLEDSINESNVDLLKRLCQLMSQQAMILTLHHVVQNLEKCRHKHNHNHYFQ